MKDKSQRVGYTTGVFDLFHIGHLNILKAAKLQCDYLIVGVTTDELAEELKGKKPVIPFQERCTIVQAIKYVDEVVPQSQIDEIGDHGRLGFNIIFKGDDWKGTPKWDKLEKEFAKLGVIVSFPSYTKHTSSTLLKEVLDKI